LRVKLSRRPPIVLTDSRALFKLLRMGVRIKPETESRLLELAVSMGRAPEDLVEDALAGYLAELAELRTTLDSRYDDLKSGRVKPVDGKAFFESLRQRGEDLLKKNPTK
jgi:hypothetical protein